MTTSSERWLRAGAAVGHAIYELKRVPAGHLYASVMGSLTLEAFEVILGALVQAGLVRREGDELVWVDRA